MHHLEIDNAINCDQVPSKTLFDLWVSVTLGGQNGEITIKMVSKEEITQLNHQYRHRNQATDVLSFPYEQSHSLAVDTPLLPYLGDIAMCPEILQEDAKKNHVDLEAHWAHITIHSVLHLLGYDHQSPDDQIEMERLESQIMQDLKLHDPWDMDDKRISTHSSEH